MHLKCSRLKKKHSAYLLTSNNKQVDLLLATGISNLSTERISEVAHLKTNSLQLEEIEQKNNRITQGMIVEKKPGFLIHYLGGQASELCTLVKHSGIYAITSSITPLISLVLAPFLTHTLSAADYGILTLLNMAIGLVAGITQLGLGSAFFRAYNYDYVDSRDKRDIVATTTLLLFIVSILMTLGVVMTAPFLAHLLFGCASLSSLIVIAAGIILVQNLTIPSFAWLRAESRVFSYSLLSVISMLITLLANIVLVGVLHWGIIGALIATSGGYVGTIIYMLPVIILRVGIRIRMDIARNLLGFGLPLVLNFVSYWILQLSDRYLLSHFSSLAETAKYAVVYTLGSIMSVIIIGPFTLAWPSASFSIAKRHDAAFIFKLVFRWFSLFLLFSAFILSFIGVILLDLFFPAVYHSGSLIICIVSASLVFYGIYYIFTVGVNIIRKTWIIGSFTTVASLVNIIVNLVLIPRYGAMGAAFSTFVAYVVLALAAYIVNQRVYPIPFEIGRFIAALLLGAVIYIVVGNLTQSQVILARCSIYGGAWLIYGGCLVMIGKLPALNYRAIRLWLRFPKGDLS